MTVPQIKVKVVRRPQIKVKTLVKFPANIHTLNFLTVTNSGGTYTFSVDYSVLTPGPIIDPTTAYVAVSDTTAGVYKTVTLASLLTSGLDADLQAIAALSGTGILVRTASNTWALRTNTAPAAGLTITNPDGVSGNIVFALANDLAAVEGLAANGMAARTATDTWTVRTNTGTAAEITVTNGDGVAGNPTYSLPSALTFTGKTITGGTYSGAVSYNKVVITAPATSATLTLIDGTTLTGPAASGTVMTLGNNETVTGVKTFGAAGNVGKLVVAGTTSGTTVLNATAIASGTLTLPAATDTLIGKATTDILTNKTYDTAGAGNSFSINSLAATANTGTGAVVRATSPALVTPALGTPTALVLTSATGLPLSGLTTQAAFTFVGNNTSGAAVPTAVDIATLTSKGSPAATDLVMISDQAASGAWKKVLVSALASAGSVASFNGLTGTVLYNQYGLINHSLAVSAAGSALTIALKDASGADASATSPIYGNYRSPTGTTGSWVQRSVTAANSLVISSGSTLGVTSATAFRLWVVLFDDAATMRLGVINCSTASQVFPLNEGAPTSSTAEGGAGAADSAGVFYTGTAVTAKSFLIVGYIEWSATGLTAGTWTTTNVNFLQSFGPGIRKPGEVVQSTFTSTTSTATVTSNTFTTTNLSQAITPTSAANLIRYSNTGALANATPASANAFLQTFRGSTAVGVPQVSDINSATALTTSMPSLGIDAPNTASSVTYSVRIKNDNNLATLTYPAAAGTSGASMVLDEIMG